MSASGVCPGPSVGKRPTIEDATESGCRFHPRRKAIAWTEKGPLCRECFTDEDEFHREMGNDDWYSEPFRWELTDEERYWVERAEKALMRDYYGVVLRRVSE